MANRQKISQMTPKGANLAPTDLLEISEDSGSGYITKSITGQEIIDGAGGAFVPYTGATANVDLGTNGLFAGEGAFQTAGSGDALTVSKSSGSGISLMINKTGANEGLKVNKISGAGNAATVIGTLEATTLVKTGGTAAQFLMADGTTSLGGGGGLTVGTTAIASGTDGRVLFQASGVLQQDSTFFWDNTNKRLGVGATPASTVRLDVRAQGALAADIAFRVRNSADNQNIISVLGNGNTVFNGALNTLYLTIGQSGASNALECFLDFAESRGIRSRYGVVQNGIRLFYNSPSRSIGFYVSSSEASGDNTIFFDGKQNIRIGQGFSNINQPDANATRTIQQMTGVPPTTSPADGFQQYSADITAGNAAPHFRTENGAVVKVYQETTAVTAAAFVANTGNNVKEDSTFDGYTLAKLVKALRNQGLLA